MTFRLGLTGSIGMGKSTTAALFAEAGCAVWDADAAVHRLYATGGAAVEQVARAFPDAVRDGAVSRDALRAEIVRDPGALPRIEAIVHPLVQADRAAFGESHSDRVTVYDIPLLFETGAETEMDATACVTVSRETQEARVRDRGSMTEIDLDRILARQMPNERKCALATYVIETDTLDHARTQVHDILRDIRRKLPDNA